MSAADDPWFKVHFRTKAIVVHGLAELERVKARKVPKVILVEPAITHVCSTCGKVEAWGDTWEWFGAWADIDDGRDVLKFCSSKCRPAKRPAEGRDKHIRRWDPTKDGGGVSYIEVQKAKEAVDPRKFPFPQHPPERFGNGWCRWCGEKVTEPRRKTWHSDCLHEFHLHTVLDTQFRHLVQRDGWGCATCPRPNGRLIRGGLLWHRPSDSTGMSTLKWSVELQVDHIVPLWSVLALPDDERRVYFGPVNLWLLCTDCHKRKSAAEAADRAAGRA